MKDLQKLQSVAAAVWGGSDTFLDFAAQVDQELERMGYGEKPPEKPKVEVSARKIAG